LVIEDPFRFINPDVDLAGDRLGLGASWVDPAVSEGRDEYNLEVYYRFPLFPNLDVTLDAQYMIDPALIPIVEDSSPGTKTFDDLFAFTVRFRTTF
jgi:carbohydrate-selective porin OprB